MYELPNLHNGWVEQGPLHTRFTAPAYEGFLGTQFTKDSVLDTHEKAMV